VKKSPDKGKDKISFGVTVPQFYVNCEWSSDIERTREGHILPKVATVNGQPLLVRIEIDDEDVAGKLFSFMYRILYGSNAVAGIVAELNSKCIAPTQDHETAVSHPNGAQTRTVPPLSNVPPTKSVQI